MVVAKKWIYAKAFSGMPTAKNFRLEEEILEEVKENEFLAEALFLSVDPYMRSYMTMHPVGAFMIGGQVARVVESKNPDFPVGSIVCGSFGWRTHTICNPEDASAQWKPYVLPDFGKESLSLGLGVLGMPGQTAYFGFLEICQPKAGETVVVSCAAGAVGSTVGQIAKIKGCKVVGITGSDEKCHWLESIGFDHAVNYKKPKFLTELKKVTPDGVDCFFDGVGGKISEAVRDQMNTFGRISVCGSISNYNTKVEQVSDPQADFVWKQLRQEGFIVWRWDDRRLEAIRQNLEWIQEGKLKVRETITEGFENMPKAFIGMLTGENIGKAVVKV